MEQIINLNEIREQLIEEIYIHFKVDKEYTGVYKDKSKVYKDIYSRVSLIFKWYRDKVGEINAGNINNNVITSIISVLIKKYIKKEKIISYITYNSEHKVIEKKGFFTHQLG